MSKNMNGDISRAIHLFAQKAGPEIKLKLQYLLTKIDVETVMDDDRFAKKVIPSIKMSVNTPVKELCELISDYDTQFEIAMFHLRDELIVASDFSLDLAYDFDNRLAEVLKEGFEESEEPA